MVDTLFNETAANEEVIKVLIQELRRRSPMADLLRLEDGTVIRAIEYEVVTQEELQVLATELSQDLALVKGYLPADPYGIEAPVEATPEVPAQPEQPVAPAETPATEVAPTAPEEPNIVPPADAPPAPVIQ